MGEALGLSFANTFGVIGGKDFIQSDIIKAMLGWLKVIGTLQTGFGVMLLFLFGLALSNRLLIK